MRLGLEREDLVSTRDALLLLRVTALYTVTVFLLCSILTILYLINRGTGQSDYIILKYTFLAICEYHN